MTGRAERLLLASLLCVGLLSLVAVNGAAAAGTGDYCEGVGENRSAIVGGAGDTVYTDEVTLHPGSTLTVGYCSFGEPADRDWLSDGTGYEVGERDGHTYTVTITGETETVDFADHFADGDQPTFEDRLVVTVAESSGTGPTAVDGVDDSQYRSAVDETENATTALNETTSGLEADEVSLDDANETVYSLREEYKTMTETRTDLLGRLRSAGENGTAAGTVAAAAAADEEYERTDSNVTAAATAYTEAVEATADGPRSTVRLSVLGSLGAGVALGLVAGAAVPLIAARRVKEKMKLSRDVSYDRKTALLPILIGIVAAVGGAAILAVMIGIDPLLRVIA
ncbi:hypothetical protein DJ69_04670 [Halorubrum persicum]|uniref:Uncharacterized protein n=1 Tax=Halorubrum persicum TaxID=1383844 RepID=A0A2G1WLG0_9EURY|nr:hypothetical protein [Halorubrum persicum]PHQ39822.1 hypothetical protein DJ69_04670 [Halorubrum persicum]